MKGQNKQRYRVGILGQVAVLFLIGMIVLGSISYYSQRTRTEQQYKAQVENLARTHSIQVMRVLQEYPSYHWLIDYWHDHYTELDIEYDTDFYGTGTRTEEKCHLFNEHHPEMQLRYISLEEIRKLSPEDQKLYAEIAYSWLITRVNQMKRDSQIDFLFCVLTKEPYNEQFFLFSAAGYGEKRGTNYEEVYPIGVQVEVGESQQEQMRAAIDHNGHLASAGNYVDYYEYVTTVDGYDVLIGTTYNVSGIMETIESQTKKDLLFMLVHQGTLALACLSLFYFFVLVPLGKIQKNIHFYKETKNSAIVRENLSRVQPRNEIGDLSEDVVELSTEIDHYLNRIETITAEKEKLATELTLAARIQEDMLNSEFPPFPNRSEFDIYASMDPAKEVGGDFYDFFFIDEDHLCLVIADVSGKGIPAALFMMASKIILANNALNGASPGKILENTNNAICATNQEEMFVTVWLGILDIRTGEMICANGGHEYPTVKTPDGKYELLKDPHGFVIGGMDGMKYKEYTIQLEPGSRVFVYTDGLPEATNSNSEMFGTDRIIDVLNEDPNRTPEEQLKRMTVAVDEFVKEAEQFDDLTMLGFVYYGKDNKEHMN